VGAVRLRFRRPGQWFAQRCGDAGALSRQPEHQRPLLDIVRARPIGGPGCPKARKTPSCYTDTIGSLPSSNATAKTAVVSTFRTGRMIPVLESHPRTECDKMFRDPAPARAMGRTACRRLVAAAQGLERKSAAPACAIDRLVVERIAHRNGCVIGVPHKGGARERLHGALAYAGCSRSDLKAP
jgi:hypothetical protein